LSAVNAEATGSGRIKSGILPGLVAMKNEVTWVLVLNSTRARILRGLTRNGSTGASELVLRTEHRNLRDIMADKPGRSFASSGGQRRSAMEYRSDVVRADERTFAGEALNLLDSHRRAGDFDRLAILASPEMLGIVRDIAPSALLAKVTVQQAVNLMHETETELARHVAEFVFGR
jgi:protein required for attachment to host cells